MKSLNDNVISKSEHVWSVNGSITKIPKLILSLDQAFFKIIVNVIITLLICKGQISETFYSYMRIRKILNDG